MGESMISLDDYRVGDEQFVGGANLYYHEMRELLAAGSAVLALHSLPGLLENPTAAKDALGPLTEDDVVLSNAGHYAYIYHHFREKLGLRFRIVRDVQAAFHAGYFLQEELCGPLTRDGDLVLFPSHYCRKLYLDQFRDFLDRGNTAVSYPMPPMPAKTGPALPRLQDSMMHIGYLGRVSAEKNVDQLLSALASLRSKGIQLYLTLVGQHERANSPWKFSSIRNKKWIAREEGRLLHEDALRKLASFDLLAFPSTSSMETLGRVLLEAAHLKVPVLAAAHAAVPEFVPKSATVAVQYMPGYYPLMSGSALARIDEESFAAKLEGWQAKPRKRALPDITSFKQDRKLFLRIVEQGKGSPLARLNSTVNAFLDRIEIHHRNPPASLKRVVALTADAFRKHDYRHMGAVMAGVCPRAGYKPVLRIT